MTEQVTETQDTQEPAQEAEPRQPQEPNAEPEQSIDEFLAQEMRKAEQPERERDEQGRFKSTKPPEENEDAGADKKSEDGEKQDTEPEKGGKAKEGEEEEAEKDEDGKESAKTTRAPNAFNAKQREAFYALPPEQQQNVLDIVNAQTKDYTQKTQELSEQRKNFEALDRALAPHRTRLAHMGVSEAQMVSQLLTLAEHADRDPVGFLREQARLRGISPEQLGGQQQQGDGQPPANDPEKEALFREVQELKQLVYGDHQERQSRTLDTMSRAVDEFASDTENYPFYGELEADMVPIVEALRKSNPQASPTDILKRAYNEALSMNDEVKAKADADARAKQEAERIAREKERANEARRAAGVRPSSNGAFPGGETQYTDPQEHMEDFLREKMRERA